MSNAFWAAGSTFQVGDGGSPEVFVSVAEITKLTALDMDRAVIDVSHHLSPSRYKEKLPGWRDAKSLPVEANWLPNDTTQDETTGVLSSFNDDLLHNYRVVLPGAIATINLRGFLKSFKGDLDMEKQGQLSFEVELSGKPTIT